MCALLMLNYDQPSHIFPCILLTSDHVIFLVQFGINKYLCLFIPNCTWNHVITYTKQMILAKIALVSAQLPSYIDKFLLLTGRQCWTIPIMSSRNESVIHSLIPNCTWNHVITYTKQMILAKIALVSAQLPSYI